MILPLATLKATLLSHSKPSRTWSKPPMVRLVPIFTGPTSSQLTEQDPQQRIFHAVVTNDADAIAAHDFQLKVVE